MGKQQNYRGLSGLNAAFRERRKKELEESGFVAEADKILKPVEEPQEIPDFRSPHERITQATLEAVNQASGTFQTAGEQIINSIIYPNTQSQRIAPGLINMANWVAEIGAVPLAAGDAILRELPGGKGASDVLNYVPKKITEGYVEGEKELAKLLGESGEKNELTESISRLGQNVALATVFGKGGKVASSVKGRLTKVKPIKPKYVDVPSKELVHVPKREFIADEYGNVQSPEVQTHRQAKIDNSQLVLQRDEIATLRAKKIDELEYLRTGKAKGPKVNRRIGELKAEIEGLNTTLRETDLELRKRGAYDEHKKPGGKLLTEKASSTKSVIDDFSGTNTPNNINFSTAVNESLFDRILRKGRYYKNKVQPEQTAPVSRGKPYREGEPMPGSEMIPVEDALIGSDKFREVLARGKKVGKEKEIFDFLLKQAQDKGIEESFRNAVMRISSEGGGYDFVKALPGEAPVKALPEKTPTPEPPPAQAPKKYDIKERNKVQADLMQKAGIPETDMIDYALDSTADGKKLGKYAEDVIDKKITLDEAAERVKNDYSKMIEGKKEAPNLQEESGEMIAKKLGYDNPKMPVFEETIYDTEYPKLEKMHKEGKSNEEIAKALGKNVDVVAEHTHDIDFYAGTIANQVKAAKETGVYDSIVELSNKQEMTPAEIAQKLKTTEEMVGSVQSHLNIEPVGSSTNKKLQDELKKEYAGQKKKPVQHIIETPVNELPGDLGNKIKEQAKQKLAEIENASMESTPTSFLRENTGEGWEVSKASGGFTINTFPEWFSQLGGKKDRIIKALEKIISGEQDKGPLVERLKDVIIKHLAEGETLGIREVSKGGTKKHKAGEVPPDEAVSGFLKQFAEQDMTPAELRKMYDEYNKQFEKPVKETPDIVKARRKHEQAKARLEEAEMDILGSDEKTIEAARKEVERTFEELKKREGSVFREQLDIEGTPKISMPEGFVKEGKDLSEQSPLFEKAPDKNQGDFFVSDEAMAKAKKDLEGRAGNLNLGFDADRIKALATLGAGIFERGFRKFADWSAEMERIHGSNVAPYLRMIYGAAAREVKDFQKRSRDFESKVLADYEMLKGGITRKEAKTMVEDSKILTEAERNRIHELQQKPELTKKERVEMHRLLKPKDIDYSSFKHKNKVNSEKNPVVRAAYELMFDTAEQMKRDMTAFDQEFSKLLKDARKSRGFQAVRRDKEVISFLEDRTNKAKYNALTDQEKALADYLVKFYEQAKPIMTDQTVIENYVTHVRRGFLESMVEDGFIEAFKEMFSKEVEDVSGTFGASLLNQMVRNEKFNPFELPRIGELNYSQDLAKIMRAYGTIYHIKKAFDPLRPNINRLNSALLEAKLNSSADFVTRYVKAMTGDKIDNLTPKGLNRVINGLVSYNAWRYLTLNMPAGVTNTVVGKMENWVHQKFPKFVAGEARFFTKKGSEILEKMQVVDGESFDTVHGLRRQFGKALNTIVFAPMRGWRRLPLGERYIQGTFYLGELTRQEFNSGVIAPERHRQIIEKIGDIHGAYRDVLKPDVGNVQLARPFLQFRLWALAKFTNRYSRFQDMKRIYKEQGAEALLKSDQFSAQMKDLGLIAGILYLTIDEETSTKKLPSNEKSVRDVLKDAFSSFSETYTIDWWRFNLKNLAPSVKSAIDAIDAVDYTIRAIGGTESAAYKVDSRYGGKGDIKATRKAVDLIPIIRQQKHLIFGKEKEKRKLSTRGKRAS